jgi:hypothetical protein
MVIILVYSLQNYLKILQKQGKNMKSSSSAGERLRTVAEIFGGVKELAEKLSVKPQSLYPIFKGEENMGRKVGARLTEAGINYDWYLTGLGEVFADNDEGKNLRAKYSNLIHNTANGGNAIVQQANGNYNHQITNTGETLRIPEGYHAVTIIVPIKSKVQWSVETP